MNKAAHYLQQHLIGEVLTSRDVLRHFSTDGSIFSIPPMLVVHPRAENDIRKSARFAWQLAERGRVIPLTVRGWGTDQTGAAIGRGIVVSTTAHMNKIIELDPKSGSVTAQAGATIAKLQQALHTHGRFIPSTTDSTETTTLGGAVANNDAGRSSYQYGPIREHVIELRAVLANGEVIQTRRLSKREVNKKLGAASFEGQLYRQLDQLIEESSEVIKGMKRLGDRNNLGYAISQVKSKDGTFDLTPLFVGSQGTLGIISEITLESQVHEPNDTMVIIPFTQKRDMFEVVAAINKLKNGPRSVDFIDKSVISFVQENNPNLFKNTISDQKPEVIMFVEFEAGRGAKRMVKLLKKFTAEYNVEPFEIEREDRDAWDVARDSVSMLLTHAKDSENAIPLLDDAWVPIERCAEFLEAAEKLVVQYTDRPYAFWGQAGSGILHTGVMYDLAQLGDKQKSLRLLNEYYSLVAEFGGTIAARQAEGRLRGSQSAKILTNEEIALMEQVKKIFDPFGVLNPGVKVGVDEADVKASVRSGFVLGHAHTHLPRG